MKNLSEKVRNYKSKLIRFALEKHHGNIRAAARELGETPSTMQRWVAILELGSMARDLRYKRDWWVVNRGFAVVFYALLACVALIDPSTLKAQYSWPTYPVNAPIGIYKAMVDNGSGVAIQAVGDSEFIAGVTQQAVVTSKGNVPLAVSGATQMQVGSAPVIMGAVVTSDANGNAVDFAPPEDGNPHCAIGTVVGGNVAASGFIYVRIAPICYITPTPSTGAVSSVFGRTGVVTAVGTDYSDVANLDLGDGKSSILFGTSGGSLNLQDGAASELSLAGDGSAFILSGSDSSAITLDGTGDITVNANTGTAEVTAGVSVELIAPDVQIGTGANLLNIGSTGSVLGSATGGGKGNGTFNATGLFVNGVAAITSTAGLAPLASPGFTGVPTAPTATAGTNTTQLATTAFVLGQGFITSSPVASVFGRTGAVVATSGDYTVAQVTGAAPIASPGFTGIPTAPTASVGTNTTQLATTAFTLGQGFLTSSTGANTGLSNLSTVAINAALLPGTTNTIALGNSTHLWTNLFSTALNCGLGGTTSCVISWNGSTSGTATATVNATASLITWTSNIATPTGSCATIPFQSGGNAGIAFAGGANTLSLCAGNTEDARLGAGTLDFGTSVLNLGSSVTATADIAVSRLAAGVLEINNAAAAGSKGTLKLSSVISVGTKFTATGCSNSTTLGGATAGSFASGTSGTCTVVVTMGDTDTAPNGWSCSVHDVTTAADTILQTATAATTATFSGTTVSGDVIIFGCQGF